MTSSRKRAADENLSPKIRSLAPQALTVNGHTPFLTSHDLNLETKLQDAVRQAIIALGNPQPATCLGPQYPPQAPPLPPPPRNVCYNLGGGRGSTRSPRTTLEGGQGSAEGAGEGGSAKGSRESTTGRGGVKTAPSAAPRPSPAARGIGCNGSAAFASHRAHMARESQAITQKLQELQNTPHHLERSSLPPHLIQTPTLTGQTSVTCHQQPRRAEPLNPTTGLAEPSNPAQVSATPAKTAPQSGAPRPGEAFQK